MSKNDKLLNKFLEKPAITDITLDEVHKLAKIIGAAYINQIAKVIDYYKRKG